jgi:hypothetical protein
MIRLLEFGILTPFLAKKAVLINSPKLIRI